MKYLPALLFLAVAPLTPVDGSTIQFNFVSDPGDFIGQGQTLSNFYDTTQGSSISAQIRRTVAGGPAELLFIINNAILGPPNSFGLLFFGTDALGIPIQPGTYTNAQRADFATPGHPGLDISFQNRGSNTVTGNFTVSEVTFNLSKTIIQTFVASFEQHSEGSTPALRGTVNYQLTPVPEGGSLALMIPLFALFLGRRVRPHTSRALVREQS